MHKQTKAAPTRKIVLLLLISGLTAFTQTSCLQYTAYMITGTVTKVASGDVFQLVTSVQTKLWGRLYGVDAPETYMINPRNDASIPINQPYGDASMKALKEKILGRLVHVGVFKLDNHHRLVGIIWLSGRNINLEMVREGYAEVFVEYLRPPYRSKFLEAQQEAKSAGRGIWSLPRYERPRDFRKRLNISDEEE